MNSEKIISDKYNKLKSLLNEKSRRIWAATEAKSIGRGGPAMVSRAIGMSVATIHKGVKELALDGNESDGDKSRSSGGGRKSLLENIEFKTALENLIEDTTRGDPESPLLWTCKSTYLLRDELMRQGFNVSQRSICTYLEKMGYSLQANKKTEEGGDHPDRDEQFKFIYRKTKKFLN